MKTPSTAFTRPRSSFGVASALAVLRVLAPVGDGGAPRVVGVDRAALSESTAEVARAIDDALARWAVTRVEVDLPDLDEVARVTTALLFYEAARVHRATYEACPDAYGAYMRARLERAFAFTDAEYTAARDAATAMRGRIELIFRDVDAIVGPTVGFTAPTLVEAQASDTSTRLVRFTRLWNAARYSAISVPVPTTGLPIGLQIAARSDADAVAAAASFETAVTRAKVRDTSPAPNRG
jgi:aspartyl-tRNA(Asn)/glutamyl-tRNA(Gln) amidotransferase subunit A